MCGTSSDVDGPLTVRDLRRRWKPTKERLLKATRNGDTHPLPVRLHRAFSWMAAVENFGDSEQLDQQLIFRWIALNALYGRWDGNSNEPTRDGESLKQFISHVLRLDREKRLAVSIREHRKLAMSIFEDQYVNDYFWKMLRQDRAFRPGRTPRLAEQWYRESNWTMLLDELLDRIYLVRCQLVYGAATCEGKINRRAVRRCGLMLELLLKPILLVMIDHGLSTDWGALCYPPINQAGLATGDSSTQRKPK